jgi:hypothetical protein
MRMAGKQFGKPNTVPRAGQAPIPLQGLSGRLDQIIAWLDGNWGG